jgi:tRNA(adenine34) deaminase
MLGWMPPLQQDIQDRGDLPHFMREAVREAKKAFLAGEVPVGAILIDQSDGIVARAHNRCILDNDPTAHAEILAIRHTAKACSNYRLNGMTLVVTIEPCPMCMGAIINARLGTLVFGAFDEKGGAAGSVYNLSDHSRLNHRLRVIPGVMERECRELMQAFFREKR